MQLIPIETKSEIERLRSKIQEAERNVEVLKAELNETRDFLRRWRRMLRLAEEKTAEPSKKRKEQNNATAI